MNPHLQFTLAITLISFGIAFCMVVGTPSDKPELNKPFPVIGATVILTLLILGIAWGIRLFFI